VSRAGAIGLGQLLPETARAHGVDPWNPADNLRGTAAHLGYWLSRCGYTNGIAAYNGGTRACYGNWPPDTVVYVPKVISIRGLISSGPRSSDLPGLPRTGAGGLAMKSEGWYIYTSAITSSEPEAGRGCVVCQWLPVRW
jgi:hypothetical protein